jgi:hypothetical protein
MNLKMWVRSLEIGVIRSLKIDDLKLYILCAEIFSSPKGHEENGLADGGCCYARDYVMERNPTGAQQRPG